MNLYNFTDEEDFYMYNFIQSSSSWNISHMQKKLSSIINLLVFTLQLKKESITDAMEIPYIPTQSFCSTIQIVGSTLPYMSL